MAEKPKPYELTQLKDGWKAMANWQPTQEKGGWRLSGKCPRCEHETSRFIPTEITTYALKAEEGDMKSGKYEVWCECGDSHSGRPDGKTGCGAHWGAEITHPEFEAQGP